MNNNRQPVKPLPVCSSHRVLRAVVTSLLAILSITDASTSRADDKRPSSPADILSSADVLWHFANTTSESDPPSALELRGEVKIGVELTGQERDESLARGGDGRAADLNGGWLRVPVKPESKLDLRGDTFTALVRLKVPSGRWATRGFFTRGGGHDRLAWNFFSHDFDQGPSGMMVGCEIGIEGRAGLGGQVKASVEQIGASAWHDLVVRYDGRELTLFVDGVPLDRRPTQGKIRTGNVEPLGIGAATSGEHVDLPMPAWFDHAALWRRPLSDDEIIAVSGGVERVRQKQAEFAKYRPRPQTRDSRPATTELVDRARELRRRFQADPHRPRFHFLVPEEGECMPADPNGAIFWKGRYHLFYIFQRRQEQEPRTVHCWGHASSVDLVHWTHHPVALDVAPADPDRGIFSGNALLDEHGTPTLLYHGVGLGNCIATSTDDLLLHWKKSSANPIVPIPKPGDANHGLYESWDPHGWREDSTTYAIFGGKQPALFRGSTLTNLKYVGPFLPEDRWSEPGEDVSCPDFFRLGDRHLLLCISHRRGARYFLGRWENERFIPESHARMNWPGGGFFAPETLVDDRGRRILWAWVMDERPAARRTASGWSGLMSFPRVLSLDDRRRLRIEPAEEWQRLRYDPRSLANLELPPRTEKPISDVRGKSLAISARFASTTARRFGLRVCQSPQNEEATTIEYDRERGMLRVDVSRSSLDPDIRYRSWCIFRPDDAKDAERRVTVQEAPLTLDPQEPLELLVLLDHSILEVFANGRQCLTQRVFPTRDDADGISLFTGDEPLKVEKLETWQMDSAGVGF